MVHIEGVNLSVLGRPHTQLMARLLCCLSGVRKHIKRYVPFRHEQNFYAEEVLVGVEVSKGLSKTNRGEMCAHV